MPKNIDEGDNIPSGYRKGSMQQFTPEQMELYQSMFPHLSPESFLNMLATGDQSMFEQMEAPAMKQFQQLQSQTASQFSGMGMGAQGGSGFRNQLNQQTSDFAQQLHSQRMGIQNNAIKDLMGMSNTLLGQRPKENFMVKKEEEKKSGWGGIAGAVVGGTAGMFMGGPMGAMAGASLGSAVGNQF